MAVVHVKEVTNRDASQTMRTDKRYTRTFQVLTDDPKDGARVVRDDPAIPVLGDSWFDPVGGETDDDAVLIDKRAVQSDQENFQNWMVTCEYAGLGDPLAEPPQVNWHSERYQETINVDVTGRPIVNSAGQPFESGVTRDRTRYTLTIQHNTLSFDPVEAQTYIDTLNDGLFLGAKYPPGFGRRSCKMEEISGEEVFYPNFPIRRDVYYVKRRIVIAIDQRDNAWDAVVLDSGFTELNAGGTVLNKMLVGHGSPSTPMLLDGNGHRLPVGYNPLPTTEGGDVTYFDFTKYASKDWDPLGIEDLFS